MSRRGRADEGPAYKADTTGPDGNSPDTGDIAGETVGAGKSADAKPGPRYRRPTADDPATVNPASASGGYTDAIGGRSDSDANFTIVGTGDASASDTEPRRGRGRPPGSKTRAKIPSGAPLDISGIEKLLLGIHTSLARLVPEAELSSSEAHELASAYADVAQYYPILRLPDKWAAIINFGTQVAMVYGSRFAAWRIRMLTTPQPTPRERTEQTLKQVFEVPPNPNPGTNGATRRPPAADVRTGEVPGVGNVEFPPDHPLIKGNKLN